MAREEMMAYILDSVPYRIVFVDTDHVIRYMNRRAHRKGSNAKARC